MGFEWVYLVPAFVAGVGAGWWDAYRRGARVLAQAMAESVNAAERRLQDAEARVTEATSQLNVVRSAHTKQGHLYEQALADKTQQFREVSASRDHLAGELRTTIDAAAKSRDIYPHKRIPVVSSGQAVAVIFEREGVETAHRRVEAIDLDDTLFCPRLDPQEQYSFSHVDTRGRFVYRFEKDLTPAMGCD